jgi:hypothetical protein
MTATAFAGRSCISREDSMTRLSQSLLLATALSFGMAMPAMADWDRIGGVDVSHSRDRDVVYSRFGGGVDRLRFDARESDVNCRSVKATFRNGRTREIFHGRIRAGRFAVIDLPGDNRHIRKISFNCRAGSVHGATIAIMADIGSYRSEWRHSPDWNRMWSRLFHWGTPGPGNNDWVRIDTKSFDTRNDLEVTVAGWSGRHVDRIAVKPLNGDARCSSITAKFGNGKHRALDVDRNRRLKEDHAYTFDLPGKERNLKEVAMRCTPVGRDSVRVEVMANK